jgi:hypothetical protein
VLFRSLGHEPLIIDRVAKIEVLGENLLISSQRRERYAATVGSVLAVRLAADTK